MCIELSAAAPPACSMGFTCAVSCFVLSAVSLVCCADGLVGDRPDCAAALMAEDFFTSDGFVIFATLSAFGLALLIVVRMYVLPSV